MRPHTLLRLCLLLALVSLTTFALTAAPASPELSIEVTDPGRPDTASIEATPGWLKEADARRTAILRGIRPFLASDESADVMRFTMRHTPLEADYGATS